MNNDVNVVVGRSNDVVVIDALPIYVVVVVVVVAVVVAGLVLVVVVEVVVVIVVVAGTQNWHPDIEMQSVNDVCSLQRSDGNTYTCQ